MKRGVQGYISLPPFLGQRPIPSLSSRKLTKAPTSSMFSIDIEAFFIEPHIKLVILLVICYEKVYLNETRKENCITFFPWEISVNKLIISWFGAECLSYKEHNPSLGQNKLMVVVA